MKGLLIALGAVAALTVAVRVLQPRFAFFPMRGETVTPSSIGIAFHAATITTSDREQLRGWFLPHEHARALVVSFHGNGGNLSEWLPIVAGIHRAGYSIAAIDYRGYGLSTGSASEKGLYRDVDAALGWAMPFRAQGVPVVFWGRSLGTTMAAYAATRIRPDGLILESGFPNLGAVVQTPGRCASCRCFPRIAFPPRSTPDRPAAPYWSCTVMSTA